MKRPRIPSRMVYVATFACLIAFGASYALAAITITNGSQTGTGNYVGATSEAWWTATSTPAAFISAIPSSGLTAISTAQGTNTVLAATATSYSVGTVTAGDVAEVIKFSETTAAPINTFFEIQFTLSTGATTTTTAYIETQTSAPGSTVVFTFYLDAGSAASSSLTINSVQQVTELCGATAATCP